MRKTDWHSSRTDHWIKTLKIRVIIIDTGYICKIIFENNSVLKKIRKFINILIVFLNIKKKIFINNFG